MERYPKVDLDIQAMVDSQRKTEDPKHIKVRAILGCDEFVLIVDKTSVDFRVPAGHVLVVTRTDLDDGGVDLTLSRMTHQQFTERRGV